MPQKSPLLTVRTRKTDKSYYGQNRGASGGGTQIKSDLLVETLSPRVTYDRISVPPTMCGQVSIVELGQCHDGSKCSQRCNVCTLQNESNEL